MNDGDSSVASPCIVECRVVFLVDVTSHSLHINTWQWQENYFLMRIFNHEQNEHTYLVKAINHTDL
jgi:hypothetical protein